MVTLRVGEPDKWVCANVDLIEENLERQPKAVVFIAGASSSGKSYCAKILQSVLKSRNKKAVILSLDSYNKGLSRIIPDKVNQNYFHNSISNIDVLSSRIRSIIESIPFEEKYNEKTLNKLEPVLSPYFENKKDLKLFLDALNKEWKELNFDEPSVYDLKEAIQDVKRLLKNEDMVKKEYSKMTSERKKTDEILSGKEIDCIIVEGIYALNDEVLSSFSREAIITNFIDSNPKTLFLRRILRDMKTTSAPTAFTIKIYFEHIVPSYYETILPHKDNADVIFENDMTFLEMREGNLYKTKFELFTPLKEVVDEILSRSSVHQTIYEKDTYFSGNHESKDDANNVLRLRSYSSDEGKTYVASSLVHKGISKLRRDGKNIRPVNVLIKEGDLPLVFKDELHCIQCFSSAGFKVGPIEYKIKWKIHFNKQGLTIRYVQPKGYYIEFDEPIDVAVLNEMKELLETKLLTRD